MIILETQAAFDEWKSRMDEEVHSLKKTVPSELSSEMNYSVESLVDVEKYLLNRYSSPDDLVEDHVNYERFGRYVGEVQVKNSSVQWCIDLDNEEFAFFGSPVVGSQGTGRDSPFSLVTACIDRQTGDYLEKVVSHVIKLRNQTGK